MAAPYVDVAGACEAVLRSMADLQGENYAFQLSKATGALDFITSDENSGIKADYVTSPNGKLRKARVTYKQRTKVCDVLTGEAAIGAGLCDEATESDEKEVDVEIGDRVYKSRKFTHDRMINICQDTESFVREYLSADMRALKEQLSASILAKIKAGQGINYQQSGALIAANTDKTLNLLGVSGGQHVPLTGNYNQIYMDFMNNELNGVPALLGQGHLQTYFSLANLACCNSATPLNQAVAEANAAFFLDQAANSVLGADEFLSVAFGATHLLWFNKNTTISINTPTNQHIVIPDPTNPALSWDMDFKWDECNEVWVYALSAYFDVFNSFQADAFADAGSPAASPPCEDDREGMTGIFGYVAAVFTP